MSFIGRLTCIFLLLSSVTKAASPEYYFNQAIGSWKQKQMAPTATALLSGTRYTGLSFRGWKYSTLLSRHQKELGWKTGLMQNPLFQLHLMAHPDWSWLILCLGGWLLLLGLSTFGLLKKWANLRLAWISMGLVFVASALVLQWNHSLWDVGVLGNSQLPVALFEKPKAKKKMVDLPAGTLVKIISRQDNFTEVSQPVHGWVRTSQVLTQDVYRPWWSRG